MTQDLTVGKPISRIWQFAVPVLFGLLLQQVYSLVDTAIVGHALGVMALGGVGATGSVNFLVLGFCGGLCTGMAIRWRRRSARASTGSCAAMWRAVSGWDLLCRRCCWP